MLVLVFYACACVLCLCLCFMLVFVLMLVFMFYACAYVLCLCLCSMLVFYACARVTVKVAPLAKVIDPKTVPIERLIPQERLVKMGEFDLQNVVFNTVRRPQFVDLSIYVEPLINGVPLSDVPVVDLTLSQQVFDIVNNVHLHIVRESNHEVLLRQSLKGSRFFSTESTVPFDDENYLVHLEQTAQGVSPPSNIVPSSADVHFRSNESAVHVRMPFTPKSKGFAKAAVGSGSGSDGQRAAYEKLDKEKDSRGWSFRAAFTLLVLAASSLAVYLYLSKWSGAQNQGQPNQLGQLGQLAQIALPEWMSRFGGQLGPLLSLLAATGSRLSWLKSRLETQVRALLQTATGAAAARPQRVRQTPAAARLRVQREREQTPAESEAGRGGLRLKPRKA